jgi:hypothetical protein
MASQLPHSGSDESDARRISATVWTSSGCTCIIPDSHACLRSSAPLLTVPSPFRSFPGTAYLGHGARSPLLGAGRRAHSCDSAWSIAAGRHDLQACLVPATRYSAGLGHVVHQSHSVALCPGCSSTDTAYTGLCSPVGLPEQCVRYGWSSAT